MGLFGLGSRSKDRNKDEGKQGENRRENLKTRVYTLNNLQLQIENTIVDDAIRWQDERRKYYNDILNLRVQRDPASSPLDMVIALIKEVVAMRENGRKQLQGLQSQLEE